MQTHLEQWNTFIEGNGGHYENNRLVSFDPVQPSAETRKNGCLYDLSHLSFITAEGEEADDFLQNQFSNDIKQVDHLQSQLNSYCTPKGRVLAVFRVFKLLNTFCLMMPREQLQSIVKRLQMFVLMTKVTLSAKTNLVAIGCDGETIEQTLQNALNSSEILPIQTDACVEINGVCIIKLAGTPPRFMLAGPIEKMIVLWQTLQTSMMVKATDQWSLLEIQAGIPAIFNNTAEAFVPQMINLQHINGLSFRKGCYPGQEVVARMHYLGKQKRQMYLLHTNCATKPLPGDSIISKASPEQSIGKVVDAQTTADHGFDMLAVVNIASAEDDAIMLKNEPTIPITLKTLPYKLPKQ